MARTPRLEDFARIEVVRAKLHGLHVTGADLDYHGSITLDPDHCDAVGLLPMEFVEVWNKHSGARLQTYVIHGKRGSRCCVLNGAAARTCQRGDAVIIVAKVLLPMDQAGLPRPRVAIFDQDNHITDLLEYRAGRDDAGRPTFRTVKLRAMRTRKKQR